ncbi:MAG: hypothetical protein ACREVT_02250, partial [Burkholderiales bacterium]
MEALLDFALLAARREYVPGIPRVVGVLGLRRFDKLTVPSRVEGRAPFDQLRAPSVIEGQLSRA